jgi:hypothetical protein
MTGRRVPASRITDGVLGLDPRTQSFDSLGPWIKSKGAGIFHAGTKMLTPSAVETCPARPR